MILNKSGPKTEPWGTPDSDPSRTLGKSENRNPSGTLKKPKKQETVVVASECGGGRGCYTSPYLRTTSNWHLSNLQSNL